MSSAELVDVWAVLKGFIGAVLLHLGVGDLLDGAAVALPGVLGTLSAWFTHRLPHVKLRLIPFSQSPEQFAGIVLVKVNLGGERRSAVKGT